MTAAPQVETVRITANAIADLAKTDVLISTTPKLQVHTIRMATAFRAVDQDADLEALWRNLEATTGIEPVMAVLQTAALATWLRRLDGAGDGIRTRDIQLGKLTLYH